MTSLKQKALSAISEQGILLVFPIKNAAQPDSLWAHLWPKIKMRWEWDDSADNRVVQLWHLREELSKSKKVVYAKWYQGRATFFSRPIFTALLSHFLSEGRPQTLPVGSREILDAFIEDSPQTLKQLRKHPSFDGKRKLDALLKPLWQRLLLVGFGEVDDGAFPSLAMGATSVLFEDLWKDAVKMTEKERGDMLRKSIGEDSPFHKAFKRIYSKVSPQPIAKRSLRYEDLR